MIHTAKAPKTGSPADQPKLLRVLLGAVNGWGKTHLLGAIGKGNKALIYDTEGGTSIYNNQKFQSDPNATEFENLEVVSFDDFDLDPDIPARDVTFRLEEGLDYLIQTKNADGYSVVVLDSITELQQKFLDHHSASDPRQSYGDWAKDLHRIVQKARQVPTHVIFAAPLKAEFDEVLNREILRPHISPAAWAGVAGLFDVLAFGELKVQGPVTRRVLSTNHTSRTPGKNRTDIPDQLENPTFQTLVAALTGNEASVAPAKTAKPQARKSGNGASFPAVRR